MGKNVPDRKHQILFPRHLSVIHHHPAEKAMYANTGWPLLLLTALWDLTIHHLSC